MDTDYNVNNYLLLDGVVVTSSLFGTTLSWTSADKIDTGGPFQVTDVDDDGQVKLDVEVFSVGPDAKFSGSYIKLPGTDDKFFIYFVDNNNDGQPDDGKAYVPYDGTELDYLDGAGAGLTTSYGEDLTDNIIFCFITGTAILTADLESVPVESLLVGQQLSVSSGGSRKIKFIFKQRIRNTRFYFDKSSIMPVRILQGALGADLPNSDLLVSPSHALLIDGNLVEAHALINGSSIYQETSWDGELEYYHIELEDHSVIYANNVPAETFIDNVSRANFDNYNEYLALYSEAEDMQELEYPRAKSSRQLPKALKQKLVDRAEILYPELVIKKVA